MSNAATHETHINTRSTKRDMIEDLETEKMRKAFLQSYAELGRGEYRVFSEEDLFEQAMRELEAEGFEIKD